MADLYNSILDHVQTICTSEELMKLCWPSKEMIALGLKGEKFNISSSFQQKLFQNFLLNYYVYSAFKIILSFVSCR